MQQREEKTAAELAALHAALAEREGRFDALIRGLQVGVVVQGPASEILLVNPRALELLDMTEDQLRGKSSLDPDWNIVREDGSPFPGEDRPVMVAVRTGKPVMAVAMGIFRPRRGDRLWLLVSATPQLRADGSLVQVVATFTDITERKAIEERARAQARQIAELSTPLIPLDARTLLMPLLGALDPERAQQMLEVMLSGVRERGARVMILDVSGVPTIDAEAAEALRRCAGGLRLLGARCIVTGIRPAVADELVQLGVDLTAEVHATLERGLAAARAYVSGSSARRSTIRPTNDSGTP